jgi:5-methylcytosine-specific restriction enzyme subunit McrC
MSRVIQVFEFEKLTLHNDEQGRYLNTNELEKLYQYNDNHDNIYFTGIRDGIRFKNYVGVVQIGGLTIEILPKTDKKYSGDNEFQIWQGVLLNLLKVCRHINVDSISEASLKRKNKSILDLYFEMYVDEVQQLVRRGLIKKYRKHAGNVNALKGRLDFSRNIQKNLIHKERFYTEHQVYDHENPLNQILLKGLSILKGMISDSSLLDRINRLIMSFPEIKEVDIHKRHFDDLILNRKTNTYYKAIQIARMIILNYSPDIKAGQENMLTLLFDMNKLWEEYIYRMLVRSKPDHIEVNPQEKQKFWENRRVMPDIVIREKNSIGTETYIIDTKWKVLDHLKPKPNDDDLKQMYVYNLYWNAKKSMLLYPSSNNAEESYGSFWKGRENPSENQCKVGFVNILNTDSSLNYSIGEEILSKLY